MTSQTAAAGSRLYRTIWRWHFYAGLFSIPFILWLAATGSIYLFKPQIDGWIDRDVDRLVIDGPRASAEAQVQAALAAVPGSRFAAYELPLTDRSAVRVLVSRGGQRERVYVDPQRLTVLKQVDEEDRLTRLIFKLHGELLIGNTGSYLVELAASWAIVLLLTGLYLWWPRSTQNLGGVLYPRLRAGRRVFWRDMHAVTGLWVSAFALFLLVSGLPWAKFWGSNLKALRQIGSDTVVTQDWTSGRDTPAAGEHAGHHLSAGPAAVFDLAALDRNIETVTALELAPPVLILPPEKAGAKWTARSDAQNRPLRVTLWLDGNSGAVVRRENFADRKLLDRIIGTGVAAHEGQLFGWPNQLLGLLTAFSLIGMSVSALVLWWQRRPTGRLGAPMPLAMPYRAGLLIAPVLLLAVLLPMFGLSLVAVRILEFAVLRRIPRSRIFLGLATT